MIKFISRYFVIILLVVPVSESFSQTKQIKFNLVTGTNGVSLSKINGMTRDRQGFMWFSDQTNRCIVRFDGSHMTKYVHNPNNPNSLGGYYPECLAVDSSGNIWIGFYGMGLDKFNPATNTFTHYRNQKNDPSSLGRDSVSAVFVDHFGSIWIGHKGGLDLFEKETGTFKHFRHDPNDSTSLSHNNVRAIYEDKSGELWIGTGFTWDNNQEGGLNRLDRSTGKFTRYMHDRINTNSLSDSKVRAIFEDSYGNFWIGTRSNGLQTLDRKTGQITRYPFLPAKLNGLGVPSPAAYDDNITFVVEDADRQIWIGTMLSGIIRYDPQTKQMNRYGTKEDKEHSLSDTTSWWAHANPDGTVWISTQSANLFRIDVHNVNISHVRVNPDNNGVTEIFEESPTVLWYATLNGLLRKDAKDGTTKQFLHNPRDPTSLSSNAVGSILKDNMGNLWFGTGDALNLFDGERGIFKRYYHNTASFRAITSTIISLAQDADSTIWVGTFGDGLFMFNPRTKKFMQYGHSSVDGNTVSSNVITCLIIDGNRTIWIGTGNNGGLDKLDRQTGKFVHYMPGMTIYCMYKGDDSVLWVGTPDGLYHYDTKLDRFISLTEVNAGLSMVEVESIVADKENNLWVATETGIYMVSKNRDRLVRYGQANGLMDANNAFNLGASVRRHDGEIQFGNTGGYYAFYPEKLKTIPIKTRLYFTGLWLNDKLLIPGESGPLKEPIDIAKEIRLSHRQNIFSISATMIDFRSSGDKRVYYKLENYDNDWRSTNPQEQIQYFKVPPGKYVFRIKTANSSDGEWQEKSIAVIIAPPWWTRWWAYSLYALILVGLVVYVHRYQKKQLISKEREKIRAKQLEQAKEIEKAYHDLRATQAQLIHSEKMASLGELTAGIAHEIQNPLNFVNNFSEVNDELLKELKVEAEKGNLEEVKAIARDIQFNSEKINHHGKRADAIVKGMLQHSRTSTGQKEPTDINVLAEEYLRLAYHGLRAKDKSFNAKFETQFDNNIGKINVSPQELGRVVLNLINNAFYTVSEKKKQADNGYEPTVTVTTLKDNGRIEIKVKDNGNGIPQKVLDKIFQPFFTTKPTGQGTGLGLSLAYDIVTKGHGGELKVVTKEGEGSEFLIRLPAT